MKNLVILYIRLPPSDLQENWHSWRFALDFPITRTYKLLTLMEIGFRSEWLIEIRLQSEIWAFCSKYEYQSCKFLGWIFEVSGANLVIWGWVSIWFSIPQRCISITVEVILRSGNDRLHNTIQHSMLEEFGQLNKKKGTKLFGKLSKKSDRIHIYTNKMCFIMACSGCIQASKPSNQIEYIDKYTTSKALAVWFFWCF